MNSSSSTPSPVCFSSLWQRACPWAGFRFVALALAAGTILRVLLALAYPQPIRYTDAAQYLTIANNVIENHGYSLWDSPPYDPDVYRSPGYPLFLAAGFGVGLGFSGTAALQVFLELGTLFAGASLIGRRSTPIAGRGAFLAAMLCPFTAAFSCLFLSESLSVSLVNMLFILGLASGGIAGALLTGFVLGWLILARGGFLPAILIVPFLLGTSLRARGVKAARAAAFALVAFFTALIVLLPYGFWNSFAHNRFSLTPLSGFGRALWGGVATMPGMGVPPLDEETWRNHYALWEDGSIRPSPAKLIATDETLKNIALEEIRARPAAYLMGAARHAIHVWFGVRNLFVHNNPSIDGLILRLLGILYLVLGMWGLLRLNVPLATRLLLAAPALTMAAVLPWLWVEMRYTSVVFGPIALLAGAAFFMMPPGGRRSQDREDRREP